MGKTIYVRIIYWRFVGFNGDDVFIGGVETYIHSLVQCCVELGMKPILYQCANVPFKKMVGDLEVRGIVTETTLTNLKKARVNLKNAVLADLQNDDIIIYAADQWSEKISYKKTISIQHGISWDRPIKLLSNRILCHNYQIFENLKRWRERQLYLRFFENCPNRVCVDYNFLNWYRTYRTCKDDVRIWVIPNAAPIVSLNEIDRKLSRDDSVVKILFARRFEPFRGTRIMAEAAEEILKNTSNVLFTFAGDGSDKDWLVNRFSSNPRVKIHKVRPQNRMQEYYDHDISVIPSLGSEGTSMSVAESIGAGCATVASNSGGITNMIFDGYNGFLIEPKTQNLVDAMFRLINDRNLLKEMARHSYGVARASFSMEKWKSEWKKVLIEVYETK